MKKLLLIFLFLLGVAVLATVAGILMGGKGSAVGEGPTVLVWRLAGPVLEQQAPRLPFSDAAAPVSIAELYPGAAAPPARTPACAASPSISRKPISASPRPRSCAAR